MYPYEKGDRIYGGTMKILKNFIRERMGIICLYAGFIGVFYIVFFLYNIREDAVQYAFILSFLWLLLYGAVSYVRYRSHYLSVLQNEAKAGTSGLELPEPENALEAEYQYILHLLEEQKRECESRERISRQEMLDYYGMWVHQIKTPIAALRVMLQSWNDEQLEYRKNMELEVFKIEQYVEMVLGYLRAEDMSSDLEFAVCSLDRIVRQAIRKYSKMFIMKKIRLEYQSLEYKVLTDEKWLVFVVEQLLSNALKYTKEGSISVYIAKRNSIQMLVIEDTGIGIRAEDLPRVFERGFTGYNGRNDKKSTGIGLYLCKTILDRLGHEIFIDSVLGQGTRVYLYLDQEKHSLQ